MPRERCWGTFEVPAPGPETSLDLNGIHVRVPPSNKALQLTGLAEMRLRVVALGQHHRGSTTT